MLFLHIVLKTEPRDRVDAVTALKHRFVNRRSLEVVVANGPGIWGPTSIIAGAVEPLLTTFLVQDPAFKYIATLIPKYSECRKACTSEDERLRGLKHEEVGYTTRDPMAT